MFFQRTYEAARALDCDERESTGLGEPLAHAGAVVARRESGNSDGAVGRDAARD